MTYYTSSQHNFRVHFLVHSSSQRILGNLMVTNRSSLVLKFENVANTDFWPRPFLAPATVEISVASHFYPYIIMFRV